MEVYIVMFVIASLVALLLGFLGAIPMLAYLVIGISKTVAGDLRPLNLMLNPAFSTIILVVYSSLL